jgi:hypothetical protein
MQVAKNPRERGFVLLTMTLCAIAMVGVLGMAVDVGRAFIAKNETQAFCDSAAMSAAVALDGTATGIANAKTAVTNSKNSWNMNTTTVASPTVDFATSINGPWSTNPSPATGYTYVRVQASVGLPLYFAPVVTAWFTQTAQLTQTVNTAAIAAQIQQTSFSRGLDPYTAVSTQPNDPNFGLVVGNQYDIQWPNYNGTKFVSPTCSGDPQSSLDAVQANWGASLSGYWGSNANSVIYAEVLDEIQLAPITLGENIASILTTGDKNAQAKALDTRVQEDGDYTDQSSYTAYFANSYHNGRRLIALPVVDPTSPTVTTVLGYASFLLISDGTATSNFYESGTGNDPFCAVYVGPYVQGSIGAGGSGSAGAYRIALVQ